MGEWDIATAFEIVREALLRSLNADGLAALSTIAAEVRDQAMRIRELEDGSQYDDETIARLRAELAEARALLLRIGGTASFDEFIGTLDEARTAARSWLAALSHQGEPTNRCPRDSRCALPAGHPEPACAFPEWPAAHSVEGKNE